MKFWHLCMQAEQEPPKSTWRHTGIGESALVVAGRDLVMLQLCQLAFTVMKRSTMMDHRKKKFWAYTSILFCSDQLRSATRAF